MKIASIDRQNRRIFWMTGGISVKFLGKICLMIILKVTENQGFTQIYPPPPQGFLELSLNHSFVVFFSNPDVSIKKS